jgi:pimeloyl-ACP methyl ester carboxylesterase
VGRLHQAGRQAFAPTVLGHGEGVEKRVNHAQQVGDLVKQLVQRNVHDIVLVGYSYAGTLIARLAEEIPDGIRRLVFWNAFTPQRGII